VDEGARQALRDGGKSLLPPGVKGCEGTFAVGDVVRVCDVDGTEFARGIARFNAEAIRDGGLPRAEVIHRDDLVIL
jgi:glutamate 5-kinase